MQSRHGTSPHWRVILLAVVVECLTEEGALEGAKDDKTDDRE